MAQQRLGIARELHDIISHSVGFKVLQAGVAERFLQQHPDRAREALASIRRSGSEAVDELGRLLTLVRALRRT
ncbi:MAG: histidine kinase dimerization/phosphoacceptor domain-containing protein [Dermatophilaceae bacterium]